VTQCLYYARQGTVVSESYFATFFAI
jgi:hypothetical protein